MLPPKPPLTRRPLGAPDGASAELPRAAHDPTHDPPPQLLEGTDGRFYYIDESESPVKSELSSASPVKPAGLGKPGGGGLIVRLEPQQPACPSVEGARAMAAGRTIAGGSGWSAARLLPRIFKCGYSFALALELLPP